MENEIDKVESLRKLSENCFDWQYYRLNNRLTIVMGLKVSNMLGEWLKVKNNEQ